MRTLFMCLALLALGTASFALNGYYNDCSSLDGWSTRAPLSAPYLDYGGTAVSADTPAGTTGYLMFDLYYNGYTEPINITGGDITLTWRVDYTGFDEPPTGPIGLWLRVYSGTQNPDKSWNFVARAGYFFEARIGEGWTTRTKSVAAPEDLYGGVPLDPANVYKFRFDVVYWDPVFSPNKISIDDFRITCVPEPSSILALVAGLSGFGTLLRRRR
ncbi:MAG: PEP-CTERM sorting domain-containing protein [Armatimonadota bacterium]|nr:PEP-CTERM sorting domain-containing protein [Armatimonadota bacterium]